MKTKILFAQSSGIEVSADKKTPPSEICWMPAGETEISAGTYGGGRWAGKVLVDAQAAQAIADSFARVVAAGRKTYVDFNHEDGASAAWVTGFSWDPKRGIIASVEWTPQGAQALIDKTFYSFSPSFCVDEETGRPSSLVEGFSCGGLVNSPAFGAKMPVLAAKKNHADPEADTETEGDEEDVGAKLTAALDQIKVLTADLAAERAAGLRIACKAAPDHAAVILASIPKQKITAQAVIVSPGVEASHRGDMTTADMEYANYMARLKNSRPKF
jgi:phage I-like protein